MTVPRSSSPLTLFSQISLAIQLNPSAHPVTNLKHIHEATPDAAGINASTSAPLEMPTITLRLSPSRPMSRGYSGPHRMTAIRLAALTAPTARAELPARLKTMAIRGGWKPKIKPTPRLEGRMAASGRGGGGPPQGALPGAEGRTPA